MSRACVRGGSAVAVVLLAAAWCLFGGAVVSAQETVRVSTVEELVRALGPGREILLEPGRYDLARAYRVQTSHVGWEYVFDGRQLVVRGVDGLTLRAELGATILAEPRYAYTLCFRDCRDILLEGLTLGHTEAGYCAGGVVGLERCEQVYLEGCALYGSGTVGIQMTDCLDVTVRGSAIGDCTAGAVWARGSARLTFHGVEMLANDSWPLIDVAGCLEVSFQDCRIAENFGAALLAVDEESRYVAFPGTLIERNGTDRLVDEWSGPVDLSGAVLVNNAFYSEDREYYDGEYDQRYDEGYDEEPGMDYDLEGIHEEGVEE